MDLKGSQVTSLVLSNRNIGCNELKHLAQELKNTQTTSLTLKNYDIDNEDVKYLAEALKETQITELDLRESKIGCDAAEYLYEKLSNTTVRTLYLYVYCSDDDVNTCIEQDSYVDLANVYIKLTTNKIGIKGAQYLNKTFQSIGIADLRLHSDILEADDAQYLAQAFKDIKIINLSFMMDSTNIQYLIQAFKSSQIITLNFSAHKIGSIGAKHLAVFLKEVKVLRLDLGLNYIGDKGMKHLAPALENNDIIDINLAWNRIESEGAQYLANILWNSKICFINLCNNNIGAEGAKYLAYGLRNSQVTGIHLHGNSIQNEGYQYLSDVADDTNISWVNLHGNGIEWTPPKNLGRSKSTVADMLCHAFKELVSLNPVSNEFEFTAPKKDVIDIDQYAFLVKTLNSNPNSKVHIFEMMCKKDHEDYDLIMMDKINEFTAAVISKFCSFIENKLPELIESFGNSSNNYKLVKQFEEMGFYNVVENLLLHRMLYYVDEDQEILHPYIYKMLAKYNMPLYSEYLEPDKKNEIISYCRENLEVEGAMEVIDLLDSKSFQKKD